MKSASAGLGHLGYRWSRAAWRTICHPGSLGTLTLAATAASALAAWYTWQASVSANQVAKDSQAFAQKVYSDQIALSRPAISVLSGESSVSKITSDPYFPERISKDYAVTLILRNSGLRDAPRAWVALSSDRYGSSDDSLSMTLVALLKEADVPVRFELSSAPETGT